MTGAIIALLFLSVVFFVGLYVLIVKETESTTITDRETAQREAFEAGGTNTRKHAPGRSRSGKTTTRQDSERDRPGEHEGDR